MNLEFVTSLGGLGGTGSSLVNADGNRVTDISTITIEQFTEVIAHRRCTSRKRCRATGVQQSYEFHQTNLVNLEAAHGRIMDVDVAMESTRFARQCFGSGKCIDDGSGKPTYAGCINPTAIT